MKKLHLMQLDVKNAFLHGGMDATIFIKQPEGYNDGTNLLANYSSASTGYNNYAACGTLASLGHYHGMGFVCPSMTKPSS